MSTTQVFAELLITGIGVLIWLTIGLAAALHIPLQRIATGASVASLVPIAGVAYVLGILVDRVSYGLFSGWEQRIRASVIRPDSSPAADEQEKYILVHSEELTNQITYNRSRLRVCRAWILNFLFITASATWWATGSGLDSPLILTGVGLALAALTLYVWLKLAHDYYINIQSSYAFLAASRTDAASPQIAGHAASDHQVS